MRKFTIKDFIAYNNPCFSCNSPINFKIYSETIGSGTSGHLNPTVLPNYTEIDLSIKYSNMEALKLFIVHKTNKILCSNNQGLTKYLSERKLTLVSTCDRCKTQITSEPLKFDLEKGHVEATYLKYERLMVHEGDNIYQIDSNFETEKSVLIVEKLNAVKPLSPLRLNLPILPKYRFKDRAHFLNKVKTYIIFS
jgi:hypothetical protein